MKIGTMSQQKRPQRMKSPRFFNWDAVPRQMISSAITQVLPDSLRITSFAVVAAAVTGGRSNLGLRHISCRRDGGSYNSRSYNAHS
jgi:hypothetical protein